MKPFIKNLIGVAIAALAGVTITLAAICANLNHRVNELEALETSRWQGIVEAADTVQLDNTLNNRCDINRNMFRIMRLSNETK